MARTWLRGLVGLAVLIVTLPAWAGKTASPEKLWADGEALLRQGDVEAAATLMAQAARVEPARTDWVERAVLVRRIVGLRGVVAAGADDAAWDRAVASLHLFYLQNDLPRLAVEVDRKAFDRRKDAGTALRLAEADLAAGENVDAANVVAAWSATSRRHAIYHVIALARLGRLEDAKAMSDRALAIQQEIAPEEGFERARMWALLGNGALAIQGLKESFEATPAAALPAQKDRARKEADFASLSGGTAFAEVLKTESKVAETCSGGSSCAGCPKRGSCGGTRR